MNYEVRQKNTWNVFLSTEYNGQLKGSVLGPLIFNIDMIDLFYECEDSNGSNYVQQRYLG